MGFPFSHSKDVCPRQDGECIANRGEAPSQVRQASFARAGRSTGLPKRTESPNGRARGRFPDKADRYSAATKAEPLLLDAMTDAENAGDFAGLLTVLNDTMGFYRSQGRHQDNQWIIQRAIELALRLGLDGTDAWTTTLINAATSQRAAGNM